MRLNRVLLLAATINIMIFALVFTVSCSGDDGKPGKQGDSCTVEENEDIDGWDVICGSDVVGELRNNNSGEQGAPGAPGDPGAQGSYCLLGSKTVNGYEILCGGASKGFLDACTVTDYPNNPAQSDIVCGKAKAISTCGGQIYDPTKKFCNDAGKVDDPKALKGKCAGKEYNTSTDYCGFASKAAAAAKTESILPLCGLDIKGNHATVLNKTWRNASDISDSTECKTIGGIVNYNTSASPYFCIISRNACNALPGGYYFAPAVSGGKSATITQYPIFTASNGGECTYLVGDWDEEYCQYSVYLDPATKKRKQKAYPTNAYCGAVAAANAINRDSWKSQYCGYKAAGDLVKSVVTGVCDDYDPLTTSSKPLQKIGPNEIAFGRGYCTVLIGDYKDGKTTTTHTEDLCGSSSKNKPNNGKWANEYCGKNAKGEATVYADLCDDLNEGPNESDFKAGYCKANRKGETAFSNDWCLTGNNDKKKSVNEGSYQGQYCGYKDAKELQYDVLSGICDDDQGPNESGYKAGYCQAYRDDVTGLFKTKLVSIDETCDDGNPYNQGSWKGEYCGKPAKDSTNTVLLTGACDDSKGPNSETFGGGYCRANRDSSTVYTSSFCGEAGKPNEGSWKGEYCGLASATSPSPDKVYTGICDDDQGPNSSVFEGGYCQGILGSKRVEYSEDLCGGAKLNEGSWKGEYCFTGDNKVAICTGGFRPNVEKKSTDAFTVRCTFQNSFICSDNNLVACDKDGCDDLGAGYAWDAAANECREAVAAPK